MALLLDSAPDLFLGVNLVVIEGRMSMLENREVLLVHDCQVWHGAELHLPRNESEKLENLTGRARLLGFRGDDREGTFIQSGDLVLWGVSGHRPGAMPDLVAAHPFVLGAC